MADGMKQQIQRAGFVTLLGRPNVGKSTFLNQVLGVKLSAVTPRPQTTRNRIIGIHDLPDAQLVFIDTPGIHRPRRALNQAMVEAAWATIADADAGVLLVEASPLPADLRFAPGKANEAIIERLTARQLPCILAINKVDRVIPPHLLPMIDTYRKLYPFTEIVPICARTGEGVAEVLRALVPLLPEGPRLFPEDQLSDRAQRFFAAELIREQIFLLLEDEVPYGCAVKVDRFHEPKRSELRVEIEATIVVEEARHKAILVGKGGSRIKELGMRSRSSLEELCGRGVILRLYVRAQPGWSDDPQAVRELGYEQ
ncbi:MAG: GTPase Era [Deltaproteobacteria bacterium]|nr:GTPase Era [Deltaproteobacteria bacterium]